MSAQNVLPRVDRRVLAVGIGALATVLAFFFDIQNYENFLLLLGSVFVPLFAVFIVDYFVINRRQWDIGENAPARWEMLIPWAAGFVMYQLVNPGGVGWWARWWTARRADLFTPPTWMGATIASFAVAAVLAYAIGELTQRRRRPLASSASPTA